MIKYDIVFTVHTTRNDKQITLFKIKNNLAIDEGYVDIEHLKQILRMRFEDILTHYIDEISKNAIPKIAR